MSKMSLVVRVTLAVIAVPVLFVAAAASGVCEPCARAFGFVADAGLGSTLRVSGPQVGPDSERPEPPEGFNLQRRPGSVDLEATYDVSNATIPLNEVHTLLPRDAIPALTDPKTRPARRMDWLEPDDRVIMVEIDGEVLAAPFKILNYHEVVNDRVGGEPVALTYCPLCDSASAFSRDVSLGDGKSRTLEFGVSGALFNSNVLMYDRQTMGLWSQLAMEAVTGPHAGASLDHLPVRVLPWSAFSTEYPEARVVSRETGHQRPYERSAYQRYFSDDALMVDVRSYGDEMPRKTLGLGIYANGEAIFIAADALGEGGRRIETPAGEVHARAVGGGIEVLNAPAEAHTAQTFYYSWSAFRPETRVLTEEDFSKKGG